MTTWPYWALGTAYLAIVANAIWEYIEDTRHND